MTTLASLKQTKSKQQIDHLSPQILAPRKFQVENPSYWNNWTAKFGTKSEWSPPNLPGLFRTRWGGGERGALMISLQRILGFEYIYTANNAGTCLFYPWGGFLSEWQWARGYIRGHTSVGSDLVIQFRRIGVVVLVRRSGHVYGWGGRASPRVRTTPWAAQKHLSPCSFLRLLFSFYLLFLLISDKKT